MTDPVNTPEERGRIGESIEGSGADALREFLSASVAVWREIDKLTEENGGEYPGLPQSTALRQRERRAWENYRDLLDESRVLTSDGIEYDPDDPGDGRDLKGGRLP